MACNMPSKMRGMPMFLCCGLFWIRHRERSKNFTIFLFPDLEIIYDIPFPWTKSNFPMDFAHLCPAFPVDLGCRALNHPPPWRFCRCHAMTGDFWNAEDGVFLSWTWRPRSGFTQTDLRDLALLRRCNHHSLTISRSLLLKNFFCCLHYSFCF